MALRLGGLPSQWDQEPEAVIWTMWDLLMSEADDAADDDGPDPMSDPAAWGQ